MQKGTVYAAIRNNPAPATGPAKSSNMKMKQEKDLSGIQHSSQIVPGTASLSSNEQAQEFIDTNEEPPLTRDSLAENNLTEHKADTIEWDDAEEQDEEREA